MVDLYAPERFSVRAALSRPFRIAGDRPWGFTGLVLFELALILAISVVFGAVIVESLDQVTAEPGSPEALDAEFGAVVAVFALLPMLILWGVASEAAWYRLLLDRKPHVLPPYRLWADEGQVFVVYLVILALLYAAMFAMVLVVLIPVAMVEAAISAGSLEAGEVQDWLAFAPFLIIPFYFGMLIVAMRFAVAVPVSLACRELRIFSGWPATRGMVWRMLASHMLVLICYIIVAVIVVSIAAPPITDWLNRATGNPDANLIRAGVAAYLLIMHVFYILSRGVNAEAAMVHLYRERRAAEAQTKAGAS